jgi:hypothetical protein
LSEINAPAMLMAVRSMKAHFNASTVAQKGHEVDQFPTDGLNKYRFVSAAAQQYPKAMLSTQCRTSLPAQSRGRRSAFAPLKSTRLAGRVCLR